MNRASIHVHRKDFVVLQTTEFSQTAVMTLEPGDASGEESNTHPHSDQTRLAAEGEVSAEIKGNTAKLKAAEVIIVPTRTRHRFNNSGPRRAVTFSVYAPPGIPG